MVFSIVTTPAHACVYAETQLIFDSVEAAAEANALLKSAFPYRQKSFKPAFWDFYQAGRSVQFIHHLGTPGHTLRWQDWMA